MQEAQYSHHRMDWPTLQPPLRNEDEEDGDKEEDVGDPLASTEHSFPSDKES